MLGGLARRLRARWSQARLAQARDLAKHGRAIEAVAIWTELARQGVPRAQTNLGASLATGRGIARDDDAALHWLLLGAKAGDPLGQRNLASLLLPNDPAAALPWYRKAAEQDDAISQDQLSLMLLSGEGTLPDPAAARLWAERAARHGVTAAAARLGTLCHEAIGGPRDTAQAAHWWHLAATAGDGDAAARLGAAYHLGQGVAADQIQAMAWLLVGSGRQSSLVRPFFTRVEAALAPADLAQARKLAAERLAG